MPPLPSRSPASAPILAAYERPDAFSPEECAAIRHLAAGGELVEAGLVGKVKNDGIRRAGLAWLDERAGAGWVMDRLIALVAEANREHFDFALDDFAESAQVARYGAEAAGHFDWHSDIGHGPVAARRKLTLVAQLSDPAGYAGGTLELMPDARPHPAPRPIGAAVLFPSFVLHRVTPVTAGERWSLTVWAHGPAFR